ncbi:hypothetical protein A0257_08215 [Hymenobacter psoromatis]|nr:hypothetical protein A0257_08215 [Hymenobacter psoromatis]
MRIAAILSARAFEHNPSYQLIFEWEEDLGHDLNIPVLDAKPLHRKMLINRVTKQITNKLGTDTLASLNKAVEQFSARRRGGLNLVFELYVATEPNFTTSAQAVPILVDFWKHTDLAEFYHTYRDCKLILVSSLEALNFLKENNCPLPIEHLGLSLSDRYRLEPGVTYIKEYDILLAGRLNIRTNQRLRDYLERFVQQYPNTEYLYQQEVNGELYYVSNQRGMIGKFQSREDYVRLLRASKISFYSTPGLDGGEKRTGGFNPVTPRYLELLSAQCLLLGRYPDNEETAYYELKRVCPNIENYEEFEQTMLDYLQQKKPGFDVHREILAKHYTSCRTRELTQLLVKY